MGNVDYYIYDNCDGLGVCGFDLYEGENVVWGFSGQYFIMFYVQCVSYILVSYSFQWFFFFYVVFQVVYIFLQFFCEYLYCYCIMGNVVWWKYVVMVICMDEVVCNIIWVLKCYGFYNNSVIIFFSDNGGQIFLGGSNWLF